MKFTIYLSARHYSGNLIKQMRAELWSVDHYSSIWGIYAADLVVPIIKHPNKALLEHLSDLHGIDVLMGTPGQTVNLYLTSGDNLNVEIPLSSPFEIECSFGKSMATKIKRVSRKAFDFETL